jgi:hypothetical protein
MQCGKIRWFEVIQGQRWLIATPGDNGALVNYGSSPSRGRLSVRKSPYMMNDTDHVLRLWLRRIDELAVDDDGLNHGDGE